MTLAVGAPIRRRRRAKLFLLGESFSFSVLVVTMWALDGQDGRILFEKDAFSSRKQRR
jgi:hypothetical protein